MKKYKVGVCGSFGDDGKCFDGQTIKTNNTYNAFCSIIGEKNVIKVNSHGWRKKPIRVFVDCILMAIKSKNVVILPAQRGINIFIPLFLLIKKVIKNKVFYSVIGGWLYELLLDNKKMLAYLRNLDGIFVETNTMKKQLEEFDLRNVSVYSNFKEIDICNENELIYNYDKPFKFCIFSRLNRQKGINEAIKYIKKINSESNNLVACLDIYGAIEKGYEEEFFDLVNDEEYITYKGVVSAESANDVIKEYYMLLFPTKYYTEGFPGTILDSFCAGVPVLSAEWGSCKDIIINMYNGLIFKFMDFDDMYRKILFAIDNPKMINSMKINCIKSADKYRSEVIISNMYLEMEND